MKKPTTSDSTHDPKIILKSTFFTSNKLKENQLSFHKEIRIFNTNPYSRFEVNLY